MKQDNQRIFAISCGCLALLYNVQISPLPGWRLILVSMAAGLIAFVAAEIGIVAKRHIAGLDGLFILRGKRAKS